MKTIQVLLREDVHPLGRTGDVVSVAAGYARNYLLPKKLAISATAENRDAMQRRRERIEAEEAALAADTRAEVERLSALVLKTSGTADENGHLYGSVNASGVAELLAEAGYPVEERRVRMDSPIKRVGSHTVLVHVRGEANAEVTLEVAPEGGELPAEPQQEPPGGDSDTESEPAAATADEGE